MEHGCCYMFAIVINPVGVGSGKQKCVCHLGRHVKQGPQASFSVSKTSKHPLSKHPPLHTSNINQTLFASVLTQTPLSNASVFPVLLFCRCLPVVLPSLVLQLEIRKLLVSCTVTTYFPLKCYWYIQPTLSPLIPLFDLIVQFLLHSHSAVLLEGNKTNEAEEIMPSLRGASQTNWQMDSPNDTAEIRGLGLLVVVIGLITSLNAVSLLWASLNGTDDIGLMVKRCKQCTTQKKTHRENDDLCEYTRRLSSSATQFLNPKVEFRSCIRFRSSCLD